MHSGCAIVGLMSHRPHTIRKVFPALPVKYIVWIKEDGKWIEQGDGPLTAKQAERISKEIRRDCGCAVKVLPVGTEAQ